MTTAERRAEALGRPLTPLEQAADDEADAIYARRAAQHEMWKDSLGDFTRAYYGMPLRETK